MNYPLRSNSPNVYEVDDPTVLALANLSGVPMPRGKIPVDQKRPVVDDALDWVRENDVKPDVDEPTLRSCRKAPSEV